MSASSFVNSFFNAGSAVFGSTATTVVGTLALAEHHVQVRNSEAARKAREDRYWASLHEEAVQSAKTLGYKTVDEHLNDVDNFRNRYK